MALIEASVGKPMPTINKVLDFCYSYDPDSKKYAFQITKIIGIFMLFAVGVFLSVLIIKTKKSKTKSENENVRTIH